LNIGIIPWNGKVNITRNGTAFDPAATVTTAVPAFTNPLTGTVQSAVPFPNNSPVPLLSPPPADWQGCVYSRFINNAVNDDDADIVFSALSSATGDWNALEPVTADGEPISPGVCVMSTNGSECTPLPQPRDHRAAKHEKRHDCGNQRAYLADRHDQYHTGTWLGMACGEA
jgi:hypothetical protein